MKTKEIFNDLKFYLILWFGQTASQLGSEMTAFALNIWAFQQEGTVMSVALLMVCSLVPKALASIPAGTLVDKWNRKAVMLVSDSVAALVSVTVFVLALTGRLRVGQLYAVKAVLGVCAAFQNPAANVVTSLMVPRQHYMRVSGLQSFSGSFITILQPILATAVYAFGGLRWVLIVDLVSFVIAVSTLAPLRVPDERREAAREPFGAVLREGLGFLRGNRGIRTLIGYQGVLNLMAGIAYYSVLTPMILARTGGNELILGTVSSFIGVGMMGGALLVTVRPPKGSRVTIMCVAYMLSFALCDFAMGVGRTAVVWCAAAALGNAPLTFGDGCLTTLYRENIPTQLQGRVFAARNALVHIVTVAGYLIGAVAADYAAPALLALDNPVSGFLRALVGVGEGRSLGVIFVCTSICGVVASLSVLRSKAVRGLEGK